MKKTAVRLHVILARDASEAVVLRRGPSKLVQLLKWHTNDDTFEHGQWFKGRIYERRCDLSPSGRLFVYFAAKYKGPLFSWTAISKPPFLTALALWKGLGTWYGGGLFDTDRSLALYEYGNLVEGFAVPEHFSVRPSRTDTDDVKGIYRLRLLRDGWRFPTPEESPAFLEGDGFDLGFRDMYVKDKVSSSGVTRSLHMVRRDAREPNDPADITDYRVVDQRGASVLELGRADWADWDKNGDLLYARHGKIFRLRASSPKSHFKIEDADELLDLRKAKFKPIPAEPWARRW